MVINKRNFRPPGWSLWIGLLCILIVSERSLALLESAAQGGCNAAALHAMGVRGEGIRIGLITVRHARTSHEAFFDRDDSGGKTGTSHVYSLDATDNPLYEPDWHDTPIAGMLVSRGDSRFPAYVGMAPAAEVYNVKVTQPEPQGRTIEPRWIENALDQLVDQEVHTIVTGFQMAGAESNGQSLYSLMYDYYADQYDILFAIAAGNKSPGVDRVSVFGDCYNGITVAGLVDDPEDIYSRVGMISNPGPTTDGRRKPELAAPGRSIRTPAFNGDAAWSSQGANGETSWAVPHAAGCIALLYDCALSVGDPDSHRSEVLKAVLINSANPNVRDRDNNSTADRLWHPQRGYGRIDTLRAANTLGDGRIFPSTLIRRDSGWAWQTMSEPGQEDLFYIEGIRGQRLRVTLTWNRRVYKFDSLNYAAESPMFNLDLTIYDPSGQILFEETDRLNNLEKADLLLPADGFYEISVRNLGYTVNRDYGLAFEIMP